MPRVRQAAALLLALTTVAACGSEADTTLHGLVREPPLEVGQITLPDVTVGAPGGPMAMQAAPGELLLVYFGYTSCPDICPTTMVDLKHAVARLGGDSDLVDLAMVTVDPDRDTPEVLTGYLDYFHDRFHAVRTDDPDELRSAEAAFLARSSVTTNEQGEVEVTHTGTTYAVDDTGTVVAEWPFGTESTDIAHDLALLLAGGD